MSDYEEGRYAASAGGEVEYRRRGRGGAPTSYLSPVVSADVFLKG